jgi:ArsR family transcriptional regulator, arsenate/arsenite/antimonite-responsive transcriptional repressor
MPWHVYTDIGIYALMKLLEIYKCLCDETRLRMLHLLTKGSLCVCHFQTILDLPQVMVSKHLAYLRAKKMVESNRHEQWMIYSLPASPSPELDRQLRCLQDCVQSYPVFKKDLSRLAKVRCGCDWIEAAGQGGKERVNAKR